MIPEDVADLSSAQGQQLLENLIKEGLSPSGQEPDPSKYRKLVQVLLQNCILKPIARQLVPNQQQATYTLSILQRQLDAHPNLLYHSDDGRPFYQWLLPKLLYAAATVDDEQLYDDIVAAVRGVFAALARDVQEDDSRWSKGPRRLQVVLGHVLSMCSDTMNGRKGVLFGFDDVPNSIDTIICATTAIAAQYHPLVDSEAMAACVMLSRSSPLVKGVKQERRYVMAIKLALHQTQPMGLLQACTHIALMSGTGDPIVQQAQIAFYETLRRSNASLRFEVWWTVYRQSDDLDLAKDTDFAKAVFLLSPSDPRAPIPLITHPALASHATRWYQQVASNPDKSAQLRSLLQRDAEVPTRKRKRSSDIPRTILKTVYPHVEANEDIGKTLLKEPDLQAIFPEMTRLICNIAGCDTHASCPLRTLSEDWLDVWIRVGKVDISSYRLLCRTLEHTSKRVIATGIQLSSRQSILTSVYAGLTKSDRSLRIVAGRALSLLFGAQEEHPNRDVADKNRLAYIAQVHAALSTYPVAQETSVLLFGDMGRQAVSGSLGRILQHLVRCLGLGSGPLRSLAYTELLNLAKHHNKTPYNLLSPYFEPISIFLVENLARHPDMLTETMQFIGDTRQAFLGRTTDYTLPAMVLSRNRHALDLIASIVDTRLGVLLMDKIADILARAFLSPRQTSSSLAFLVKTIQGMTSGHAKSQPIISASSLMTACIVDFLTKLIVELGDELKSSEEAARTALEKARQQQGNVEDLGVYLKPQMLGVISQLNDMLHDVRGKKSVEFKRKVIRSLGRLIEAVGDSMASFSPQIMASLQSTLDIPELREATLTTWSIYISTLRYADIGPFVGRTTGALVASWQYFNEKEKHIAKNIIDTIADSANSLSQFIDDVVGMDGIPELKGPANKLLAQRKRPGVKESIIKVLDRADSKNIAIATASFRELRSLLLLRQNAVENFARGDAFDPVMARVMSSLLAAAARDGECQELRDISYECLGIIGALDPDRLAVKTDNGSMTLASNFTEQEESKDFAVHLIRDLLVDAFRATNDTKHQTHLAYAIQELLKYCGLTTKVLTMTDRKSKVVDRWHSLPKDQLETLTPLLESRFSYTDAPVKISKHPIYSETPTYREWLQRWTTDLIGKVMSMAGDGIAIRDSKTIFGAFRGVLRNQDVTVAHHILPHLVLNVLLSGMPTYREEICLEINVVLQDQVNPKGPADKRALSAPVIFNLMDHLSKWLMLFKVGKPERASNTKIVESVLSGVETELMANAALQSRAYARSLRSFEQRIIQLRNEKRENSELQAYFERLHQIYAELDEPDGMEGVSAFVISPSLEHQIREHESTGRWTSAQSCWEVRLQQSPDDVTLHVGLLKCLRNLGHYDTLRTHIRGVLSRQPAWSIHLASFEAEAAWIIGDWATVRHIGPRGPPVGCALLALHEHRELRPILLDTRRTVGLDITAKEYGRAHEPLLQLHLLREIEMIHAAKCEIESTTTNPNRNALVQAHSKQLISSLNARFAATSPAFRIREAILSLRRTAYGLINMPSLNSEIGDAWTLTSKIARKAGYDQTAYSAVLQAKEADAPFAFIQQAKLLRAHGGVFKALSDVDNALQPMLKNDAANSDESRDFARDRNLAKAVLLVARWANEADRFERNEVIEKFTDAIGRSQHFESPYYHLGHYYDTLHGTAEQLVIFHYQTCHYYSLALRHGVKYIYQTMPRMLTLWLDLGENKDLLKAHPEAASSLNKINGVITKARKELPMYQFLTAFPQIVSRIVHPNDKVASQLRKIMSAVIVAYPQQALWPTVGAMQSKRPERKTACQDVTARASADPTVGALVRDANKLSNRLLRFTDDRAEEKSDKRKQMSMETHYAYMKDALPTRMILPLQDALTCALPSTSETVLSHTPFPVQPVEIAGFEDRVDIMQSLQKPKKLVFIGSDGKRYPFLCKPHDDLRKDARLMDLNSMINKLLKSGSESRRRQLYIRTYAVMPLNEECGLLEWVVNTHALKSILETGYARYNKRIYSNDILVLTEQARKQGDKYNNEPLTQVFRKQILPKYTPSVFHEWFLNTWPEPSAWLASRTNYGRTLAVMSMIGYVLGLGDRHGENILFDGLSGDTVHVDLNCLFDKGKTFDIPEMVPFRLTHNMVDALGVTGVEGVFRKAAEISMGILRSNSDSLMSVLEAFVHDPLVEWIKHGRNKSERDVKASADKNLKPIKSKLRGIMAEGTVMTVPNQVESLIKQATSPANLSAMYIGWASWL